MSCNVARMRLTERVVAGEKRAPVVVAPDVAPADLVSAEGVVVEQGKPAVGVINVPETEQQTPGGVVAAADASAPPPAAE